MDVVAEPRVGVVGKLSEHSKKLISLGLMFAGLETVTLILHQRIPALTFTDMATLGLAMSYGGRCIAYMIIGEPFRAAFTKVVKHSSGAGESVEPKWEEGFMAGPSIMMACPICAGYWVGSTLLFIMAFLPEFGRLLMYLFAAGSISWSVTRLTELIEAGRNLLTEMNGYWNNANKERLNKKGDK